MNIDIQQQAILAALTFALFGLIWLCGIVEKRFPGKSDL
jgi:hypothetical protein